MFNTPKSRMSWDEQNKAECAYHFSQRNKLENLTLHSIYNVDDTIPFFLLSWSKWDTNNSCKRSVWSWDVDFPLFYVSCPDTGPEAFCYVQELKDSRGSSTQYTHLCCDNVSDNQNIL